MKINARHLILDLLLAAKGKSLTAREAITACRIFSISENSVRVALVRLSADNFIESTERGRYRLAANALEVANDVSHWRHVEKRLRDWQGDYLAVYSGALGRSDRTALSHRERALKLLGFRELEQGLHIRPNNIERDVHIVRKRLLALGLESTALTFVASNFSAEHELSIRTLWDLNALNTLYVTQKKRLDEWIANADDLSPEVAARESYLIGHEAIRYVVFDPLLPEQMVDTKAREAFIECVRQYDRKGHEIWADIYNDGSDNSVSA